MGSSRRRFDFDTDFEDTEEEKAFVFKGKTSCRACSDFKSWRQNNQQVLYYSRICLYLSLVYSSLRSVYLSHVRGPVIMSYLDNIFE